MRLETYNYQELWESWKENAKNGVPDISQTNSETILQYFNDMEIGKNVGKESVKGGRSFSRLLS